MAVANSKRTPDHRSLTPGNGFGDLRQNRSEHLRRRRDHQSTIMQMVYDYLPAGSNDNDMARPDPTSGRPPVIVAWSGSTSDRADNDGDGCVVSAHPGGHPFENFVTKQVVVNQGYCCVRCDGSEQDEGAGTMNCEQRFEEIDVSMEERRYSQE